MRRFFLILSLFLIGCNSSLERKDSTQYDKGSFNQLTKTDFDRMADYEIKENTESLRILALKFYKKNPVELRKTTSDSPEITVNWLFTSQHDWKFKEINDAQGIQALDQVFDENFKGDRVLSLITGLYTMLITAHDNQKEFDMFDSLLHWINPCFLHDKKRTTYLACLVQCQILRCFQHSPFQKNG